jgi:predicted metalloendopeptidase
MDEGAIAAAGIGPIQPLLDRIDAVASIADVRALAGDLHRRGIDVLHSLQVAADFEDAGAYLVYVGQGGLGLPDRDYYVKDDERSVTLRDAYRKHVATQLVNIGQPSDAADAAADAILAFETRLAEASLPADQLRDPTITLNRRDVAALDELMPAFGLTAHVRELGVTTPTVSLDHPPFFVALEAALAETELATIRDYLRWHVVRAVASALPPVFELEAFDFFGRTLGGRREQLPRWRRVLDAATADIGEQVARVYVEAAFPPDAKARCEAMVGHLLSAMGRAIRDAAWMTEPTRAQALEKLATFGWKIGYPSKWRDVSKLDIGRGSFVANRLAAAAFEHDDAMGRLGEPVDRTKWEMPAHIVNAYYHPLLNEIVFAAGILQPPFFDVHADDAVNYGAIGTVIGHEITHGFDDTGSRFDAVGRLRDWWTEPDRAEFERRAEVLVEQASAYEVADGLNLNGRLTLGEDIADLGGVAIALDALSEAIGGAAPDIDGFTPVQRFFLAYATIWRINYTDEYARLLATIDPHSPGRYRTNGPLANMPAFAEAFDLREGTPMVRGPELRAEIW